MHSIFHIIILIIAITLHLSYEYFVVRKKFKEDDEDILGYTGLGIFILICVWMYSENLFVDKWEMFNSQWKFSVWLLFPYAALTGIISGSWKHTINCYRKKKKVNIS